MQKRKKTVQALEKRKKSKKQPYVIDCLRLPKDVMAGMELVFLCGNREARFSGLKGVLAVGCSRIVLQAKHYNIVIMGSCLELSYCTFEEVKICGWIDSICYEVRG